MAQIRNTCNLIYINMVKDEERIYLKLKDIEPATSQQIIESFKKAKYMDVRKITGICKRSKRIEVYDYIYEKRLVHKNKFVRWITIS